MSAKSPYGRRWRNYRELFLKRNPLCAMCLETGRVVSATVVDHITPHRGDKILFWDSSNHQSLCKECHDRHKQRIEKGGALVGCDSTGAPLDSDHHWNRNK